MQGIKTPIELPSVYSDILIWEQLTNSVENFSGSALLEVTFVNDKV